MTTPIDLWDPASFDLELRATLTAHTDLLRAFWSEDALIEAEYETSSRPLPRRSNPHWHALDALQADLDARLRTRIARVWHYTRLTDAEVDGFRVHGPGLSTADTFRARLTAQVRAGLLTQDQAAAIWAASALLGEQRDAREGQFCMTAVPFPPTYDGVEELLRYWGGEAAAFHLKDETLRAHLQTIGKPRILEIALPLAAVRPSTQLAKAVLSAHAHNEAIDAGSFMVDLFAIQPLSPASLIAVHTEGEASYAALGSTYPTHISGTFAARVIG